MNVAKPVEDQFEAAKPVEAKTVEARACALRGGVFDDETSIVALVCAHSGGIAILTLLSPVWLFLCACVSRSRPRSRSHALFYPLPPCARLARVGGCIFCRACAEVVRVRQTPRWQRDGGERRARGPPKTVSEVPRLFCRH